MYNNLGYHISISGNSLISGLEYLISKNIYTAQIFAGNNRAITLKAKSKYSADDINSIRTLILKNNFNLFIHMVYVVNLCHKYDEYDNLHKDIDNISQLRSPSPEINNIIHDLLLSNSLGARGVVIHLGSSVNIINTNIAIKNLINNINYIMKHYISTVSSNTSNTFTTLNNLPKLILETSSGSGNQVGVTLTDFYNIYKQIKSEYKKYIGICIDTSHIFASGNEILNEKGMQFYINNCVKLFGKNKISVIHLNDNPHKMGSKRDVHTIIGKCTTKSTKSTKSTKTTKSTKSTIKCKMIKGKGKIFSSKEGVFALKWLLNYARKNKISVILETSGAGHIGDTGDNNYISQVNYLHNIM